MTSTKSSCSVASALYNHHRPASDSKKKQPSPPNTKSNSPFSVDAPETIKLNFFPEQLTIRRTLPPLTSPSSSGGIPRLCYGLERCLYNRGVHWLRDPRTNVYNFDPFLRHLPPADRFNYSQLPAFRPASQDERLLEMASNQGCTFITSTSSISPSLAMIYFVLSRMKPLNLEILSEAFVDEPRTFTLLSRSPTAVILRPHGEDRRIRSIVVEKPLDSGENILTRLGMLMERLLTESKESFLKMLLLPDQLDGNATTNIASQSTASLLDSEGFAYSQVLSSIIPRLGDTFDCLG